MGFKASDFNENWIRSEINEECIQFMDDLGFYLCDKKSKGDSYSGRNSVTTSQMRNIFAEIKRIEVKINSREDWQAQKTGVLLLRPKVAYNTARAISKNRNSRMEDLRRVLEKALLSVNGHEEFKRFSQFFEGVIAYHKVHGGKD